MNSNHDPKNYQESISKKFASSKELQDAVDGFLDDVAVARKKHNIADVALVLEIPLETGERVSIAMHLGDTSKAAMMFLNFLVDKELSRTNHA